MKRYGLRIGNIGVEFPSLEERSKALLDFTKGTDVDIRDSGIKYKEGKGNFSVYERETKETIVTCCECNGEFGIDSCKKREYPRKYSYSNEWSTNEGYICDACLAKQIKDKEIFDAKKLIEKEEE